MQYLHILNHWCNMDFSVNLSWTLYVHVLVIFFLLVVFPINFVRQKQTTTSYLLRKKINNIGKIEIRNIHILSNFKEYTITISISFVLFIGFNILGFLNINKYPDLLYILNIILFSVSSICYLILIVYIWYSMVTALKYKKNITNSNWKIDLKKIDDVMKTIYQIILAKSNKNAGAKIKLKVEKIKQKYNLNNHLDQILFFFDLYENLCLYFFKIEKRESQIKLNNEVTSLSFYKVNFFKSLNEAICW